MDDEGKQGQYRKLQAMINYCHTHGFLTSYILDYFNDKNTGTSCNRCSNCVSRHEETDMTTEAQMILSCVKRMDERFGVSMTAKVLKGSRDKKVNTFGLSRLSTYGLLSAYTEKEITEWIHFLVAEQLLATEEGKFPTLKLNQNSLEVLKGNRTVLMRTAPIPVAETEDYHEELFQALRKLRKEMADAKNVPPYVLFSDMTLKELSRYFPVTKEDMLTIKGIGERKYEQYGEAFLTVIQNWRKENPDLKEKIRIEDTPKSRAKQMDDDRPSYLISYQMFQSGKSINDIAAIREMQKQTIESHIFKAYQDGHPIAWEIFFNEEEEAAVLKARETIEEHRLRPLKEALPEGYDYGKIQAVLVKYELM